MYEIEDVVELSVRTLAKSELSDRKIRNLIYNLFEFQKEWDCSFTNFRIPQLLIRYQYMFPFKLEEHPLYASNREEMEALRKKDFAFLGDPDDGYWCRRYRNIKGEYVEFGKFCCDAGTDLWNTMVSIGKITGLGAMPPEIIDYSHMILEVTAEAKKQKNRKLLALWYMVCFLTSDEPMEEEVIEKLKDTFIEEKIFYEADKLPGFEITQEDIEDLDENIQQLFLPYVKWRSLTSGNLAAVREKCCDLLNAGDYYNALEEIKRGLLLEPTDGYLLLYKAAALIAMMALSLLKKNEADVREQLDVLDLLLQNDMKEKDFIHFYKALAFRLLGDVNQTKAELSLVLQINPNHSNAKRLLEII